MADNSPSPNMSLPIPNVGQSQGPTYAIDVDNCMTIIDGHTHQPGSGVPITPNGLNINVDLPFGVNNATNLRSVRFTSQGSPLSAGTDIGCLYEVVNDLFYNDGIGNQVRITQNGAVAGTPGSIANLVSPASASYSAGSSTFIWESGANIPANMDNASVTIRDLTVGSNGVTIAAPTALAADYTLTLPAALPPAPAFLTVDSSGNISDSTPLLGNLTPSGVITMFGGVSAPAGWLACDGTSYLIATYPNLAAALFDSGTGLYAFGSADVTHFNVPDMRGVFARGVDGGTGRDPDTSSRTASGTGGNTGDNVGSFQLTATAQHTHLVDAHTNIGNGGFVAGGTSASINATNSTSGIVGTQPSTESRPINIYINYIVKI